MKKIILTISFFISFHGVVDAQNRPDPAIPQGENLQVPEGWEFRLDSPNEEITLGADPETADIYFVNMTPGWHLTTGPRGIFYHPENAEQGDYSIHTSLYYFDPKGRNREGYGLFFAGRELKDDNIEYFYFLLRNTGEYLVKSRTGEKTMTHIEWTADENINIFDETTESSVLNELAIDVKGTEAHFYINGEYVNMLELFGDNFDGTFGLRVNHNVNLHVSDLGTGLE